MSSTNTLATCPAELIFEISQFLNGHHIAKLWKSGCKSLMYKLGEQGGTTSLELSRGWRDMRSWPALIPALKQLTKIKISLSSSAMIGGDAFKAFATWPKTLTSLDLAYRNAEKIWTPSKDNVIDIASIFPVLEHLGLSGWSSFGAKNALTLPDSLTSLSLPCNKLFAKNTPHLNGCLPVGLLHLVIDGTHLTDTACAHLPASLQTLDLCGSSDLREPGIRRLPHTLTKLRLGYGNSLMSDMVEALPRSLQVLQVCSSWIEPDKMRNPDFWPPGLQTLRLKSQTTGSNLSYPSTITSLKLAGVKATLVDEHFKELPECLVTLHLEQCPLITDQAFNLLPRKLKRLKIEAPLVTDAAIALLPRYLLKLWLRGAPTKISGKSFRDLPRYLSLLFLPDVTHVTDEEIADLPPFLTQLALLAVTTLTDAFAPNLPRGLNLLQVPVSGALSLQCIPHLPKYINTYDFGPTGIASVYSMERYRATAAPLSWY